MAFFFSRHLLMPLIKKRINEIRGLENLPLKGPYILASNHQSFLDPPLIGMVIVSKIKEKIHFITIQSIWKFFGSFLSTKWLGMIPIDPQNKSQCLETAVHLLKRGEIVGIFPEGRRNTRSELLKGKTGLARLVLETQVPVVPVGFWGPPTWSIAQGFKNFFSFSKKIKINIGRPLILEEYFQKPVTRELLDETTRKIMRAIAPLCHKTYIY